MSINVGDMGAEKVLYLDDLSPRIAAMLEVIYLHRDVLDQYEQGALVLNFRGGIVKPQLDKLALTPNTA